MRITEKVVAPVWPEESPLVGEVVELSVKVITPLFGGGYEAREVDPGTVIRPATIRGHLRFWWRATAGAQFATAQDLYRAEASIWGGAADKDNPNVSAGKVVIQVAVHQSGQVKPHSGLAPRSTPREGPQEGYFLFPFQTQTGNNPAPEANARVNVSFRLTVIFAEKINDEQKNEVKNAIKAWLAFGGVGARTRRGCGALQVTGHGADAWLPPADKEGRKRWFANLAGNRRGAADWTSLAGSTVTLGEAKPDAMKIWKELGTFWARFRKGHVGNIQYNPMKGAKWRDYRGELVDLRNKDKVSLAKPYLGLPIIFQQFGNAPFSGEIKSKDTGRMASPVIVKPLALANGQFVPMVAVMKAPEPTEITIRERKVTLLPPDKQNDPVMKKLQATSALEAVIVAAREHVGTEEIKLGGNA
ncbi:MAG: type III-B CRISPR module RAMP protein Cmr1 [Fimbriimonadia bacterium]|nr:type III-B CRISPR module RAMP protein Cmr1 [Fimbriimonadia bacterium]